MPAWPEGDEVVDCSEVYGPDQVLPYDFRLDPADWDALVADTTNSIYFVAEMRCGNGTPLTVAIRRKRSGGTTKVGLKVDINREIEGQTFHGYKKLSLENGISEGDGEFTAHSLLSEYLSWRLMVLSGAISSRAAMTRVTVNSVDLGVYVNLEQVDKTFLSSRLADSAGWLYKKSGNDAGDGYQTREGEANPYAEHFCFWDVPACAVPSSSELADTLPQHLDIDQMLKVAAVNALIANTDGPILKDNNFIFYDWEGGRRLYFPWDLDTAMKGSFDVFTGSVPGGTSKYVEVMFSNWEADYDRILTDLLAGPLSLSAILGELDAILDVAGADLDSDPLLESDSDAGEELRNWWESRHAAVQSSVEAH